MKALYVKGLLIRTYQIAPEKIYVGGNLAPLKSERGSPANQAARKSKMSLTVTPPVMLKSAAQ